MKSNQMKAFSEMPPKQKIIAMIFVLIAIFVLYEVIGMLRGGSSPSSPIRVAGGGASSAPRQPIQTPQTATLQRKTPSPSQEQVLLAQQQEIQAKYLAAVNELQELKVAKEIAETNQAIIAAKLATITAQKNIINLLTVAAPPVTAETYSNNLVNPVSVNNPNALSARNVPMPTQQPAEQSYTVISVSELQSKWNAVLGAQGTLYSVGVGDILPQDKSVVISIDKSGVILEKDGKEKKISLVPII